MLWNLGCGSCLIWRHIVFIASFCVFLELSNCTPSELEFPAGIAENGMSFDSNKTDGVNALDQTVDEEQEVGANDEKEETESVRSHVVRTCSQGSANIPLQRVYVSVPQKGGGRLECIKEGWMVCFSTLKKTVCLHIVRPR